MAKVFKQFVKGILLRGESSDPSDNKSGSIWHNSTSARIKSYVEGAIRTLVSENQAQSLTNKTIDADLNTISNIENADIKVGAAINKSKLAAGTPNRVQVTDGSGVITDSSVTSSELNKLSGISGDVLTTTNVAVVTNKDIDGGTASNTSRSTLPKASRVALNALTRKQGTLVYDTTNNYPLYDDGSLLVEFGGGAGGDAGYGVQLQSEANFSLTASGTDVAGTFIPSNPSSTGSTANSTIIWLGQTFLATASGDVTTADLRIQLNTLPITGNLTAQIYNVSAGLPTTLLATSDNINAATLVVGIQTVAFTFSTTTTLSSGTNYAIVLNTSATVGLGGLTNLSFNTQGSNPYANGTSVFTLDSGASWSTEASVDSYFVVNVASGSELSLAFDADVQLEIKGLQFSDNNIPFSTESPILFPLDSQVAYVNPNSISGGPALSVIVDDLLNVPEAAVIIARRSGVNVVVGTTRIDVD
jgi:hypothetical protein